MKSDYKDYTDELKRKFAAEGLQSLEVCEILELIFAFTVGKSSDTRALAERLAEHFHNSLSGVLDAPFSELMGIRGMNENTAVLLKLMPELFKVYNSEMMGCGVVMKTAKQFGNYFMPKYIGVKNELAYVACLDKNYRLRHCELLGCGDFATVNINQRSIIGALLKSDARYIVLSHNHTNGLAVPSEKDIIATERIYEIANFVGVELLDHIIVADNDFVSMRVNCRQSWMKPKNDGEV